MQRAQRKAAKPIVIEHKSSSPEFPLVQVEKMYRATAADLMNAWSVGSLIKQWWGPQDLQVSDVKLSFKTDGKYFFSVKTKDGQNKISAKGTFLEIDPSRKIVLAGSFDDLEETFVTVDIEAVGPSQTILTLSHEGLPAEIHDDYLEGWSTALEKLRKVIERH